MKKMDNIEFDEEKLIDLIIDAYEFRVNREKVTKMLKLEDSNLVKNMCLELNGAMRVMEAIEEVYGVIIDAENMTFVEMCDYRFIKKMIQDELTLRITQEVK